MRDLKIYVTIASAILIIYLVAQYNKPNPVDWNVTLQNTDKIPFGTYILYNRLHDVFKSADIVPLREPVYNVANDHTFKQASYIIVTNKLNITEYDYSKLVDFLKQGNDVFIAASDFGTYFEKELNIQTDRQYPPDKASSTIRFTSAYLDSAKIYGFTKHISEEYFAQLDTARATTIAVNNYGNSTYVKYTFGKGTLYLSTNPLLFTNYSLLQPSGADYTARALSYLKNSKTVVWDEFYTQGQDGEESLMRVFLRNPRLQWAYYISLFGMVAFVLYEVKRRQRIIPVIEPLRNSSIDFVNVVGQVYYEQRNNSNIAQKKATYFLEHIRNKYYLKTSLLNDELVETLSQKSGVSIGFLHKLFNQIAIIRSGAHISDRDLIAFNQNIEQFYIQSR